MVVAEGRNGLPEWLNGRVEFQENDFKGRPIGGAWGLLLSWAYLA